jgi:hypothetical protein
MFHPYAFHGIAQLIKESVDCPVVPEAATNIHVFRPYAGGKRSQTLPTLQPARHAIHDTVLSEKTLARRRPPDR